MPEIKIPALDGNSFGAYIAMPAQTPAPCMIVIQEIFGINQEVRGKCDTLAAQGYIAVAPDLFWRIEPGIQLIDSIPEQLQRAFALFGEFDITKGMEDLKATLKFARTHKDSTGIVGCVGYCLGGKLAYMMATQTDIDASIAYYGVGLQDLLEEAKNIKHPLMLHIAENDQFVPPEAQLKITQGLKKNPLVTIHSYAGVDHAFSRTNGMNYNDAAATLANQRTKEFLEKHLK